MNYKAVFKWKHLIGLALSCFFFLSVASQAQTTFTHGIASNGSPFLWFKPDVSITWVDVHYNAGGGQQNHRMVLNSSTGRFEQTINASPGTMVNYTFTYSINGFEGFGTAQFTAISPGLSSSSSSVISSSPASSKISSIPASSKISSTPASSTASSVLASSTPASSKASSLASSVIASSSLSPPSPSSASSTASSTGPVTGLTNGVVDSGNTVLIWLKPNNMSVAWADIHYKVNNDVIQNVRLVFNSANARFEQIVNTSTGALTITYSFTHETPAGAMDTPTFNFTRSFSSSSLVSSSSVISSPASSIRSSVISSPASSVASSIRSSVRSSTASSIRSSVRSSPASSIRSSVASSIRSSVRSSLASSIRSSVISSPSVISSSASSIRSSVASSIRSSVASSSSSSIIVNVDRSMLIHDQATLQGADFSFSSTLQQIVNQLNAINSNQTTVEQLFARMWDTQNPTPGHVAGGEKCTGVLNGFTIECRPSEGSQADNPSFFISNYIPIALINRFDLRDNVTFNDCGEYRIIYASQGGGRNFIIFEAQLPNPNPGEAAGCLPIVQFWQSLSAENNASVRATSLRNFYFNGLPAANVGPVIDIRNYANGTGQVRANMFMGSSWNLKEFKVGVNDEGISMIRPVSVKSNPVAFLFDGTNSDTRNPVFQSDFIANMDSLLIDFDNFSLTVAKDEHNNGQSHASFPTEENQFTPAFLNANANAFQQAVANKLTTSGSNLTATQLMNRATAMTCGGCHEPSSFGINFPNAIGPNQAWPSTLGFVHVSEFANGGVFPLSPALTNVFLPARLAGFNTYIANTVPLGQRPSSAGSTSSTPSQPAKKFSKRAG